MKMKFVFVLAAFVVIASCKKENSADNSNNGDTTDYQPSSIGSTWQYSSTSQGDFSETVVNDDTTITTTAGAQQFFAIDNSVAGRKFINKTNGIYTSYGYVAEIDTSVTLQYLQDRPAGTTWSQTTTYSNVPISLNYTIASRDADKTVNNIVYKNVIGLTYAVVATVPLAGTVTIASGQSFYAKGVGLITQITNTNTSLPGVPQISDTTILLSSSIK